jgi:molybdate transport system substrate-binding protein
VALLAGLGLAAGACSDDGGETTLIVSAASSLTEAFTEIAAAFEVANEGVNVELNLASSSALATQIIQGGAPVDVFASANDAQMQLVIHAGDAEGASVFATNQLVVAVPPGSPVMTFEDLARPGIRLVLAAPDVPIGAYAREVLAAASASGRYAEGFDEAVLDNLVSEEANVRQVLTKVELGEADAGIVYTTDAVVSSDAVIVIRIPEEFAPLAIYPIAVLIGSEHADLATAFVDFVHGVEGQAILRDHGFLTP